MTWHDVTWHDTTWSWHDTTRRERTGHYIALRYVRLHWITLKGILINFPMAPLLHPKKIHTSCYTNNNKLHISIHCAAILILSIRISGTFTNFPRKRWVMAPSSHWNSWDKSAGCQGGKHGRSWWKIQPNQSKPAQKMSIFTENWDFTSLEMSQQKGLQKK